jgi:hypothetical protein
MGNDVEFPEIHSNGNAAVRVMWTAASSDTARQPDARDAYPAAVTGIVTRVRSHSRTRFTAFGPEDCAVMVNIS